MAVSPLGTVVVGPGEDIQIRSAAVLASIGDLGSSTQRAVALDDYGPIKGHNVTMDAGLHSLCTPESGAAAAQTVVGDRRVVGVIGTSCSAAVGASPILSEAGLVLILASNTAPSLTSDLGITDDPALGEVVKNHFFDQYLRRNRSDGGSRN